ncbi:MAG: HAD family phosphatase [Acidobacteriota bacterium]
MFRAVLFDFNGVLLDDEPVHFELFRKVLREEGLDLLEETYWSDYLGFDDRGCFQAVFAAAGRPLDDAKTARLVVRKASYYGAWIRENGYPFFPGAIELIHSVAASGALLGVVSGALREEVDGALRQAGVRDHFKLLVTADDVVASKPDPESYRRGLELLNSAPPLPERLIHPHEVLVLEDSPAGLESALSVGLQTLAIGQTYGAERLAKAQAFTAKVEDLTWDRILALMTASSDG